MTPNFYGSPKTTKYLAQVVDRANRMPFRAAETFVLTEWQRLRLTAPPGEDRSDALVQLAVYRSFFEYEAKIAQEKSR